MNNLSSWKKNIIIFALVAAGLFGAARVYYRLTDDIRLANMTHEMPYHKEWDIPPLSPMDQARIDIILNQPYHYIGKGAQSYAFASEDGNYVLKLFKFKHLKPSWFVEMLPAVGLLKNYKEKQAERKQRKLEGVFEGYRLAYEVHKEPSGILYIHLNPSNYLHKKVIIVDKIGFKHTIDLDKFVFILQEKAKTTRTVVRNLLDNGNVDGTKLKIRHVFDLYLSEYNKGIYDRDHGVMHNTGFVGENKVIHLDVGKLTDAPEMKQADAWQPDLEKIAYKFHTWLHINYPQHAKEIDEDMALYLSTAFDKPWLFNSNN
jgi:hypothetical protein